MSKSKSLAQVQTEVYEILEPLEPADRQKIVRSVFALFGDDAPAPSNQGGGSGGSGGGPPAAGGELGIRATRWMTQFEVTSGMLDEVFHVTNGSAGVIAPKVPGNNKAARSRNCYLLAGVQQLLATDNPTFQDADAVELCNHFSCYDNANNATTRKEIKLGGSKKDGFVLTAPCLKSAADLIKEMAPGK